MEVQLLDGLESMTTVFGLAVFAFAFNTTIILKCAPKGKDKCLSCKCSPCRMILILLYTIAGLTIPRGLCYAYLFIAGENGIVDKASMYALTSICDMFSLSFITPWICFTIDDEDKN
jgi:hypothetical protein